MSRQVPTANGLGDNRPHFVLVPLMAQGHMIPMIDMAHLIAGRGAVVSFITTPVNAARIRPVIDRVEAEGLPIRFVELEFPWARGGLPEGCENVDLVPSTDLYKPFFNALRFLAEPLEIFLREVKPSPSCMIVDYCNPWTSEVAQKLNIPRVIFHGPSCLFLFSVHNIRIKKVYDGVGDFEPVVVPDLAQRVEITKAQAPGWFAAWPEWDDLRCSAIEAEASADWRCGKYFHTS
ncbi:uncharacterized protein A4U43_C01F21090 [Asparagus officinalis]|uniref:Uncharacterized protein n=1 Tax=Asparagus officinalis TaxID=4686 RepID=A0A5P1FVF6_ASPOF|nr:uncharacterized protein A4U43_C01F21090 [Asparagus officinalis]